MSELTQKLAWRVPEDKLEGYWIRRITIPVYHVALINRSNEIQLAISSSSYPITSRWETLLGKEMPSVWLIDQRQILLHPFIATLLTKDKEQIDANLLVRVRVSDPKHFFQQLLADKKSLTYLDLEGSIQREVEVPLRAKIARYSWIELQEHQEFQEKIRQEIEITLRNLCIGWGLQLYTVSYLEFRLTTESNLATAISNALELNSTEPSVLNISGEDTDVWVSGCRLLGAMISLVVTLLVLFKPNFFSDPHTPNLILSAGGFVTALAVFGIAEWRVYTRRKDRLQRNLSGKSQAIGEQQPLHNTHLKQQFNDDPDTTQGKSQVDTLTYQTNIWHGQADLVAHEQAIVKFTSTQMIVVATQEAASIIAQYRLPETVQCSPTDICKLEPIYGSHFPGPVIDIHVLDDQRVLIATQEKLFIYSLENQGEVVSREIDSLITAPPLVRGRFVYVVTKGRRAGSELYLFDLTDLACLETKHLSDWAIRCPLVEMGGWLYTVNTNHNGGQIYRIHPDTLENELIYTVPSRVRADLVADQPGQMLWVCDVHGGCVALNTVGGVVHKINLPVRAGLDHKPLVTDKGIFVMNACSIYRFIPSINESGSCAIMPSPLLTSWTIASDLLGLVDQQGNLRIIDWYGQTKFDYKLTLNGLTKITTVTYNRAQKLIITVKSNLGIELVCADSIPIDTPLQI